MKKILCTVRFPVVVLLLLCFVGCGEVVPSSDDTGVDTSAGVSSSVTDLASTDGKVDASSDFFDKADYSSSPLPDEVILKTDTYTIERIDGFCYLTFAEGCEPEKLVSGGCIVHFDSLLFSSPEEMVRALTKTALDEYSLQQIYTFFSSDEFGRFRITDPHYFQVPVLPSGVKDTLGVWVGGGGLRFVVYLTEPRDGTVGNISFESISKEELEHAAGRLESFGINSKNEYTVSHTEDRNATVYDYTTATGRYRRICYVLEEGEKRLYVSESYRLEHFTSTVYFVSDRVPMTVDLWGTDGETCFKIYTGSLAERPSEEWLLGIETKRYVSSSE